MLTHEDIRHTARISTFIKVVGDALAMQRERMEHPRVLGGTVLHVGGLAHTGIWQIPKLGPTSTAGPAVSAGREPAPRCIRPR